MRDKLNQAAKHARDIVASGAEKAKDALSTAAIVVGDLNGDGKVDEQDARIAGERFRGAVSSLGQEAAKLGKDAIRSDMAKDAATGAVIGAAVAVPVPLLGPAAGAVVGAGLGVYKNLTKNQTAKVSVDRLSAGTDLHAELLKLEDLRTKGLLSEGEFAGEKRKLLEKRA